MGAGLLLLSVSVAAWLLLPIWCGAVLLGAGVLAAAAVAPEQHLWALAAAGLGAAILGLTIGAALDRASQAVNAPGTRALFSRAAPVLAVAVLVLDPRTVEYIGAVLGGTAGTGATAVLAGTLISGVMTAAGIVAALLIAMGLAVEAPFRWIFRNHAWGSAVQWESLRPILFVGGAVLGIHLVLDLCSRALSGALIGAGVP